MNLKVNSGFLNGIPASKMLMKIVVPSGIKKLDYGTLVFNPTDERDRLPSKTNEVVVERGEFPVSDWVQHCVGIVSDADGLVIGENGTATVPSNFTIELNNYKAFLLELQEKSPSSTALLPFQVGGSGDGIVIEDLTKFTADVSVATGVNHYVNAIQ